MHALFTQNNNDPQQDREAGRRLVSGSRIIRDTELSRRIKSYFGGKCQICGLTINLPNGAVYSEGHHIKPLGIKHRGPDVRWNIIVVCPNHHAEFDNFCIAINPETKRVQHIDPSNSFHNRIMAYSRNDLRKDLLEYHYELFLKNVVSVDQLSL